MKADLLLTGFDEVATLAEGPIPRREEAMRDISRIEKGAIAIEGGRIVWVGKAAFARKEIILRKGTTIRQFSGGVALPGFVDAHTHLVFAGSRENEIGRKVRGTSYLDIAKSGGGLFKTVRDTRKASSRQIYEESLARLRRMLSWGTTSLEAKSGYGLSLPHEIKLLRVIRQLSSTDGPTIVPTFLGGHAFPPEFEGRHDQYVRNLMEEQIPKISRMGLATFCDIFCEEGFFSAAESRRVLECGKQWGLGAKIHADEFTVTGGADVAADVRAITADHLLETPAKARARMAKAGVTAVLLPVTPFASLSMSRSLGREFVDEGVPVALGTDLSPNSWVESMPMVIAHAVYGARLTPEEAITAATVNAAHASGLGDVGRLVPGARADIAVFDLPGVEHLAYRLGARPPSCVYLHGVQVMPS
jgi:imidazolonepropionase